MGDGINLAQNFNPGLNTSHRLLEWPAGINMI